MDKYKADLEYLFKALIKHPMFISKCFLKQTKIILTILS